MSEWAHHVKLCRFSFFFEWNGKLTQGFKQRSHKVAQATVFERDFKGTRVGRGRPVRTSCDNLGDKKLIVWIKIVPIRLETGCLVLYIILLLDIYLLLSPILLIPSSSQLCGAGSQLFCISIVLTREQCFGLWLPFCRTHVLSHIWLCNPINSSINCQAPLSIAVLVLFNPVNILKGRLPKTYVTHVHSIFILFLA